MHLPETGRSCTKFMHAYHFIQRLPHEMQFQVNFGSVFNRLGPESLQAEGAFLGCCCILEDFFDFFDFSVFTKFLTKKRCCYGVSTRVRWEIARVTNAVHAV